MKNLLISAGSGSTHGGYDLIHRCDLRILPLLSFILGIGLASAAGAADWNGCYGGVSLGIGRGSDTVTDQPYRDGPYAGSGFGWNQAYQQVKTHGSGATAGVTLGCDRSIGQAGDGTVVLGAAADYQRLNIGGDGHFSGPAAIPRPGSTCGMRPPCAPGSAMRRMTGCSM